MFDRRLYKRRALCQLKGRWRLPVLLSLVTTLLTSCLLLPVLRGASSEMTMHPGHSSVQVPAVLLLAAIAACGVLMTANVGVHLRLLRTESRAAFSLFLRGMEHWYGGALGALWFTLWTSLWSLLFIIPGIVKAVSYSQMFFVLAEYPHVGVCRAMHISKVLTQGHKTDLFMQFASFAGWMVLCALTCGLGWLLLAPYMQQTFANSYGALKNEAIAGGRLCPADFAGSTASYL